MRISDWSSDVCSSDLAIFAIANHRRPAVEGIATCLRQGAIRRQSLHLGLQPWPQGSQLREGQLLANPASLIGRRSLDIPFDREQFADHHDRSEEHTSELQSLMRISYAVFCLKKKNHIECAFTTSAIIVDLGQLNASTVNTI